MIAFEAEKIWYFLLISTQGNNQGLIAEYRQIRNRLQKHKIRSVLRQKAKALEKHLEGELQPANPLLKALDQGQMEGSTPAPALVAYAMVHWSFAISVELEGYGFPFDCLHWIFYQRRKRLYEFINHFENRDVDNKPLRSLWWSLTKIVDNPQLKTADTRMERTRIFEKLRQALSIAMPEGGRGLNDDGTDADLKNIEAAIRQFREEIVADEQLSRNPVYKKMIQQIDKYWDKLFTDPITVDGPEGPLSIQPQRINNQRTRLI